TVGQYYVIYEYEEERVGEAASQLALDLLHSLLPAHFEDRRHVPADFDFQDRLEERIAHAQTRQIGRSTAALVPPAARRYIPWIRLNDQPLVQSGHGRYQKRIRATVTSETRHIAVEIASDKEETNRILGDLGLPVPRQRIVRAVDRAV